MVVPKTWVRIADELREEIRAGTYEHGARLPSGSELMDRYGVARQTVQNAVDQLRAEGLVNSTPGVGWHVAGPRPVVRLARNRLAREEREAGRGAFMSDAAIAGFTPSVEVEVRRERTDAATAAVLGIEPGAEVVVRDRVMRADGTVVQLATSRFPAALVAGTAVEAEDTGPGGSYARLEEAGHRLTHFTETVAARAPRPAEADILAVPYGHPVLTITRVAYAGDVAVEVNEITVSAERHQLVYGLDAD